MYAADITNSAWQHTSICFVGGTFYVLNLYAFYMQMPVK